MNRSQLAYPLPAETYTLRLCLNQHWGPEIPFHIQLSPPRRSWHSSELGDTWSPGDLWWNADLFPWRSHTVETQVRVFCRMNESLPPQKVICIYVKIGFIHANKWLIVNHWNLGEEGSCLTQGSSGRPSPAPPQGCRASSILGGQVCLAAVWAFYNFTCWNSSHAWVNTFCTHHTVKRCQTAGVILFPQVFFVFPRYLRWNFPRCKQEALGAFSRRKVLSPSLNRKGTSDSWRPCSRGRAVLLP